LSVDASGNEELPHNTVNFTIHGGTATLSLVWANSDIDGSPCPSDPEANATWTVRHGGATGPIVDTGSGSCPGWSGVEDVVVPVSTTPYHVIVDWWDSSQGFDEQTEFTNVDASTHGEVIELSY